MEQLQNILVIITASLAVMYLVGKFIWRPAFLKPKASKVGCGENDCGCH